MAIHPRMDVLALYAVPFACRFALAEYDGLAWWRPLLSLAPLAVVAPSTLLPRWVRDQEREHVLRHAAYALAFTVSAGTSVRWDVVLDEAAKEWRTPLLAYLAIGTATLWWFCLSHVLENGSDPALFTHQGDVAVLPLTLVAIATFAESVPDEAFQFSRSILFFVPVVVAWATLHFIAHTGFATSRTTTHDAVGFDHLARSALVVASAHLALLEVRAPPLAFQFFPVVAALLCQVTSRPSSPPPLRRGRLLGAVLVAADCGVGLGLLLRTARFEGSWIGLATPPLACAVAALSAPRLAGKRWVLPASLYLALVTCALLDAEHRASSRPSVRPVDALAIGAGYYLALALAAAIAPSAAIPTDPPSLSRSDLAALLAEGEEGARAFPYAQCSRLALAVERGTSCGGEEGEEGEKAASRLLASASPPHPTCPRALRGVWSVRGCGLPLRYMTVQHLAWGEDGEGGTSSRWWWNGTGVVASSSLAGLAARAFFSLMWTRIHATRGPWIRTDAHLLPWLRFFPATYWVYRVREDLLLRLVVDSRTSRVLWAYRMVRVLRADGTRTGEA